MNTSIASAEITLLVISRQHLETIEINFVPFLVCSFTCMIMQMAIKHKKFTFGTLLFDIMWLVLTK